MSYESAGLPFSARGPRLRSKQVQGRTGAGAYSMGFKEGQRPGRQDELRPPCPSAAPPRPALCPPPSPEARASHLVLQPRPSLPAPLSSEPEAAAVAPRVRTRPLAASRRGGCPARPRLSAWAPSLTLPHAQSGVARRSPTAAGSCTPGVLGPCCPPPRPPRVQRPRPQAGPRSSACAGRDRTHPLAGPGGLVPASSFALGNPKPTTPTPPPNLWPHSKERPPNSKGPTVRFSCDGSLMLFLTH